MQIGSVTSGYSDPTRSKAAEAIETLESLGGKGTKPGSAGGGSGASLASIAAARDVLERYDVTDITPADFSEMVQELFQAGVINDRDLGQLSAIRLELDAEGFDPDDSVDLLEFYQDRVEDITRQTAGTANAPEAIRQRLDWIQKFALVQQSPGTLGLNEVV